MSTLTPEQGQALLDSGLITPQQYQLAVGQAPQAGGAASGLGQQPPAAAAPMLTVPTTTIAAPAMSPTARLAQLGQQVGTPGGTPLGYVNPDNGSDAQASQALMGALQQGLVTPSGYDKMKNAAPDQIMAFLQQARDYHAARGGGGGMAKNLTPPPSMSTGATEQQGQDPGAAVRDAVQARFFAPQGGPATGPHALGLSPADKDELKTLESERGAGDEALRHAREREEEITSGFADAQRAAADDATIGKLQYQQDQERDAKHRAEIEAESKESRQRILAKMTELEAQGVDPNQYWQRAGTGGTIAGAIAIGLGALGSHPLGAHGSASENTALDVINGAIARDIDAQKTNLQKGIELAKTRMSLDENGFDHQMALLKSERESTQTAYEVAMRDVSHKMAMNKDNADLQQNGTKLIAGLEANGAERVAKLNDEIYGIRKASEKIVPGMGGGIDRKALVERARKIRDEAAANGKDMSPAEAQRQAAAEAGINLYRPGETPESYSKPQKGGKPSAKEQDQLNAYDDTIAGLQDLIRLREQHNGGSLSPTERQAAEAKAALLQERLVASKGRMNSQLFERTQQAIPDNPLALNDYLGMAGDTRKARMQSALEELKKERARMASTTGAPEARDDANPAGLTPDDEEK